MPSEEQRRLIVLGHTYTGLDRLYCRPGDTKKVLEQKLRLATTRIAELEDFYFTWRSLAATIESVADRRVLEKLSD